MIPQVRKKINIDHQNFSFTQNTMLSEENNMTVINNIAINSTTDKQILMYHSYTKIII